MCTRLHVCISNIQWIFYNDGRRDGAPDLASHRSTSGTRSRVLQARSESGNFVQRGRGIRFSTVLSRTRRRFFISPSKASNFDLFHEVSCIRDSDLPREFSSATSSVSGSDAESASPRPRIRVKPPCARALPFKVSLFKVKAFNGYRLFFSTFFPSFYIMLVTTARGAIKVANVRTDTLRSPPRPIV